MAGKLTIDPSKHIPNQDSSDNEWLSWVQDLKSLYGKKTARTLFSMAWNKRKSSKANTDNLRKTLKENYDISVASDGILGPLTDAADNILDGIGDTLNMATTGVLIVGGLILIPVFIALFNIAKAPAESVGIALKYAK